MLNLDLGLSVLLANVLPVLASVVGWTATPPPVTLPEAPVPVAVESVAAAYALADWNPALVGTIDLKVLELALAAASCAVRAGTVTDPATLTVIDYSKPSIEERLWVFDLRQRALVYEEFVAHGQGSGTITPSAFSNDVDSHKSSLGLFVTEETYVGRNGYSLRLNGLDRGFNDRARERAIVMHGSKYVGESGARRGSQGRSWGCPAVAAGVARKLIDQVKGGGLVFAYYPDQKWLDSSDYLGDCAAASP